MFTYYFQLGLRSLRKNPVLTTLMVVAIGFGVAASMTTYAVFRATSGDPIPQKSSTLFVAQVDNYGPGSNEHGEPTFWLTYNDALNLLRAHRAPRQTPLYPLQASVVSDDPNALAFPVRGYASNSDFFTMFDVPFRYGQPWSAEDDNAHAPVVVIGKALNDRVFKGENSVGRMIDLDGKDFRVVGVTGDFDPHPRYFDLDNDSGFGEGGQVYMPFTRAVDLRKPTAGGNMCNRDYEPGWDSFLRSECVWVSFWAELPDAASRDAYRRFLHDYAADQQRAGRFAWAPNVRLRDVPEWLAFRHVVPKEAKMSLLIAIAFLVICLVNTVGLLLAKFMRRAPEIGVRRALGASRRTIYAQFLIEASTVGLAGGALGLILTMLAMLGVDHVFEPAIAALARVDLSLIGLTFLAAIASSMLAAFYPTWRAAQVQPAWQLKSN
ncbi:MAG TPA: ABC transporter permease [Luteibacter sp.]|nr:ABC transporter permease [Luteibacter sp.]